MITIETISRNKDNKSNFALYADFETVFYNLLHDKVLINITNAKEVTFVYLEKQSTFDISVRPKGKKNAKRFVTKVNFDFFKERVVITVHNRYIGNQTYITIPFEDITANNYVDDLKTVLIECFNNI